MPPVVATLTPPPTASGGEDTTYPTSMDSHARAATEGQSTDPEQLTVAATRWTAPGSAGAAPPPDSRPPGSTVGSLHAGSPFGRRYHLIRLLGTGGMGAVYQAWDDELAVVVAIKVIRPEAMVDASVARDMERRFKRELLLARNVTHKNVVRIHDLGEIDGIKYITMPYVKGPDLATVLRRDGKLSVARALGLARQIVSGLVAAHDAGVVHRDLKPANILLDEDDRALITDFGIARSVSGAGGGTVAGAVVGTLEYMAPEQARGETVDHRADIYAFGLMLSDMLVGRRESARAESAVAELLERMTTATPRLRTIDPAIPQAIDDIVARCVEPDPGRRYPRTQDLEADLNAVTADGHSTAPARTLATVLPAAAGAAPETGALAKPVRARRAIAAGALALLVVAGIAGLVFRDRLRMTAGPSASSAAASKSVSLFIVPFRNASGEPSLDWLGPSLANMLRTEVGQSAALRAVPGDRVAQILTDLHIDQNKNLDPATLGSLANFGSANTVLWGQYVKFGNEIRIDATLQDVAREQTLPLKAQAANERELPAAIERLAASVRENLALPPEAIKELAAASFKPSSKSVQALRYYTEGLELSRQGKQLDALKKFQAATQEDPDFALAYSNLGQTHAALGRTSDAESFSAKAVSLSDALPPPEKYLILANRARILNDNPKAIEQYQKLDKLLPGSDEVLFALATLYEDTGAYDKARAGFTKLLERDPKYIDALLGAGRVEIRAGKGTEALEYLNRALTISIQRGNDEAKGTILWLLGVNYRVLNKPAEAVRYYEESLALNRRIGHQRGIANSLHSLAEIQNTLGHTQEALRSYREALQLRQQIGDTQGIGNLLIDMGNVYADIGNSNEALRLFTEALQVQRSVGNTAYEALALNNIGDIHMSRGEHEEARTYFERALSLREKLNAPLDVAQSLHNLAETYLKTGSHDAALTNYMKALDIRRQLDDPRGTAIELHSIGTIFEYQGRYGAAIDSKQEAVKIFRQTGERGLWLARLLCAYASVLNAAGRTGEAKPVLDEALGLANELRNDELTAQITTVQGEQLFYEGNPTAARALLQRAVQLAVRAKAAPFALTAEIGVARIDVSHGRADAAVPVLKRLTADADRLGLKYASVECGVLLGQAELSRRQPARARQELERARTQADRLGARILVAKADHLLSASFAALGNAADARRHAEDTTRMLDEIRREARTDAVLKRADLRELGPKSD